MPRNTGDFPRPKKTNRAVTLVYEDGSEIFFNDVKTIELEDKSTTEITFERFRRVEIDYSKDRKKRVIRIV